jgi:DnaK suppressor protein
MKNTNTVTPALPFYSPAELDEFSTLIEDKIQQARAQVETAKSSLVLGTSNDTADTDFAHHRMDDGQQSWEREELMTLIARQEKFISELERAQERIRAGTYGICRITGQRIPRERLLLVPHTTLSMAAKQAAAQA